MSQKQPWRPTRRAENETRQSILSTPKNSESKLGGRNGRLQYANSPIHMRPSDPSMSAHLQRASALDSASTRATPQAKLKRSYIEINDDESEQDTQSDAEAYQTASEGDDELVLVYIKVGKTASLKCLIVLTVRSNL